MISKSTIKLIKSLALKKIRIKENIFLVEGDKNVIEVLDSKYTVEKLFTTNLFYSKNESVCKKANYIDFIEPEDLQKASLLKNPQNCLAICSLPKESEFPEKLKNNLSIYLDEIQDPGNLGTIIRICDWFNIEYLFCSPNTADYFNPKVIQASMGSFSRINCFTTTFTKVKQLAEDAEVPIYGAFLNGENVYGKNLPQKAILVVGNEGNGIKKILKNEITEKIKIPSFSTNNEGAESLNVSVATAIICSEFKRKHFI